MYSRILLIGIIILLLSGLLLSGCAPEGTTPESPKPPESASTSTHSDNPFVTEEEGLLFQDDFEDGNASGWGLDSGWDVSLENGNYVLSGSEHSFARPDVNGWTDYTIEAKFNIERTGFILNIKRPGFSLNLRENTGIGHVTYSLAVLSGKVHLQKQIVSDFFDLSQSNAPISLNQWHSIKAVVHGNNIKEG